MNCDNNNLNVCLLFSNVLAAYASFLWAINDDDEDDDSFGDGTRQGKEDSEVGFHFSLNLVDVFAQIR